MKKRMAWMGLIAAATAVVLLNSAVQAKRIGPGDDFYVSAKQLPMHQKPSGFSPIVGNLTFGAAVKVIEVTDFENESSVTGRDVDPAWALVESGGKQGYVPTRSIVRKRVLNRQDPNQAMQRANAQEANATGKSFSESETADLQTMKGVAGRAQAGVSDESGMDAILAAPQEYHPQTAYADFRKEGQLGEFQGNR